MGTFKSYWNLFILHFCQAKSRSKLIDNVTFVEENDFVLFLAKASWHRSECERFNVT